jgi:hypothetical protein
MVCIEGRNTGLQYKEAIDLGIAILLCLQIFLADETM